MKIGLYYHSPIDYADTDSSTSPLPGAETAVLQMIAALRDLGHRVSLVSHPDHISRLHDLDVLVVKRNPVIPLMYPNIAHQYYFWSPDLTSESSFLPLKSNAIKRRFIRHICKVIAISRFQHRLYRSIGIPSDKLYVSRNGVNATLYEQNVKRDPRRCIYVSTYCDGLHFLPSIWARVAAGVPGATLQVIAARALYGAGVPTAIKDELRVLRGFSGVRCSPPVSQRDLSRELLRSTVFLYPNTLPETSSMTTLEARVAGCIIVTSSRGALCESASGNFLLRGSPASAVYQQAAAHAVIDILNNPAKYVSVVKANIECMQYYSWETIAKEWATLFRAELNRPRP